MSIPPDLTASHKSSSIQRTLFMIALISTSARITVARPVAVKKTASASAVRCDAFSSDDVSVSLPNSQRRAVLLAGLASSTALFFDAQRANAARPTPVCDPTADGAECRANLLQGDESNLDGYEAKSARKIDLAKTSTNPDLTNYQKETLALVGEMEEVLGLDIYDMTREKRISQLKKDSNVWAGKYAPGGSAKTASGRAFYNAVNQVSGHFNANGIAPLPASRLQVVTSNMVKTRELIDQGR